MAGYGALLEKHGSQRKAAASLGIHHKTFSRRLKNERSGTTAIKAKPKPKKKSKTSKNTAVSPLRLPSFPSPYLKAEEIIDRRVADFTRYHEALKAVDWFPINVDSKQPIGILWVGDPHVDADGCDWPRLKRDLDICHKTDGMYGANMGDVTNNWSGRLGPLFAEQDLSQNSARILAEWFLKDSQVPWMLHIVGNHDAWGDGMDILKRMNAKVVPMLFWKARFRLVFPNGTEIKIVAAHDFPGHSMWNKTHGPARAAQMGGDNGDLYVCGHKHTWGIQSFEMPDGRCPTIIRTRGYKFHDSYSARLGFSDDTAGSSILTIIDPNSSSPSSQIMTFLDVEMGARVLTSMRQNHV